MNATRNRIGMIVFFLSVVAFSDAQIFAPRRNRTLMPRQTAPQVADLFAYDAGLPLEETVEVVRDDDFATQYRVTFLSIRGARVPALWTVPKESATEKGAFRPKGGEQPLPSVIVQHGKGGSKESVNRVAERLAASGFATLAIDAPYHGERVQRDADGKPQDLPSSGRSSDVRDFITQFVVDLRRGVDFLQSRPEMNRERIGYVGISMGANIGGTFGGVEKRVKSVVLQVGGTSVRNPTQDLELMMRMGRGVVSTDSVYYIAKIAPRPLLMQNGEKDEGVPRWCAETLFNAANNPKQILWYESGHALPPEAQEDMADFLLKTL